MQRRILVVESESAFAEEIRDALVPNGLLVDVVSDGTDGLQQAKSNPPDLILLCVELPNMSGYSICNKLKKNPELKMIPLIIMSGEATPDIFEQHKKLKTRAEDYLIKPFAMSELMSKMGQLIDVSPASANGSYESMERPTHEYAPMNDEVEVEVGDDDIELSAEEFEVDDGYMPEDPTQLVDQDIAMATDAAFAALEIGEHTPPREEATRRADGMELLLPSEAAMADGMQTEGEPVTAPPVDPLDLSDENHDMDLETAASAQKVIDEAPISEPTDEITADPGRETPDLPEARGVALDDDPMPASRPSRVEAELRRQVAELEGENRRLSDGLQQATARAAAGGGGGGMSRDRELLGLREVINKKEKEILDLRDDADSKERQILDHKDKVRELERKARDMEEKLLAVEREMLSASERIAALTGDKEKLQQRESSVKARLSEAKEEIDKAYAEIDALKQRAEDDLQRLTEEHQAALAAEQDRRAGMLERMKAEHEASERQLREDNAATLEEVTRVQQEELVQLEQDHQRALEQQQQQHDENTARLGEQHASEQQALRTSHQENITSLQSEHGQKLEQERGVAAAALERERASAKAALQLLEQQHGQELEGLKAEHDQAVQRLRAEQVDAVAALDERHEARLAQKDVDHAGEKEALRTEHRAELDRRQQQQQQQQEQLEQDQQDRIAGMESRHRAEIEELEGTVRQGESQIADLKQELSDTQDQLRQSVDNAGKLDVELGQARERIDGQEHVIREHERQAEAYQDQLMKAFDKIRNDEALADRARRAMAVALTLLEEQKKLSGTDGEEDRLA